METKVLLILAVALISIVLESCSPVAYSTTGQNVPLFQEKNEAMVSLGYSTSTDTFDYVEGFNAQAAIAIDSSIALMSSIYFMRSQSDSDWSGKGSYADFGIGLFKSNASRKFKGEIFIGAGFGSIRNESSDISMDVKYFKPFIQPSGGFTLKHFEVAFTPRIALVSFKPTYGEENVDLRTTFVFEPGLTLRAGFKYFKFQYQTNVSTFTASDGSSFTSYNFYGSLGVSYLISKRWAK